MKAATTVLLHAVGGVDNLDTWSERNIGTLASSLQIPLHKLGGRATGRKSLGTGGAFARYDDAISITSLPCLGNDSGELSENGTVVGLDSSITVRNVDIKGGNNGILSNILNSVGLSIVVGHIAILIVLVPPLVRGRERLVGVGPIEIERVASLMENNGEEIRDVTQEGDATIPLKSPSASRIGKGDYVTDILSHLDREAAERGGHGVDANRSIIMMAEDPRTTTLQYCQ